MLTVKTHWYKIVLHITIHQTCLVIVIVKTNFSLDLAVSLLGRTLCLTLI